MGKKRERFTRARDEEGSGGGEGSPKKKHKKSKHKKHHKLRPSDGVGVVEAAVGTSPGSRPLTLKIKLGNKVIGTSEAFPPEDTSSLADSVQAGSSVGEGDSVRGEAGSSVGEGDSVRGESSLAKEDYVGSDISVGEECPVGGSNDEDEEEEWLDALEAGQVDARGYLPKKKEVGNLTARQRAMMLGSGERDLVELPLGKVVKEMTEEMQLKKTEKNRKRRLQAQKRKEKRKAETVRKLLEKQSTKKKDEQTQKLPMKPLAPHIHYVNSSVSGVSLSLPHGMEFPLKPQQATQPPPPPQQCAIEGCNNAKRYSDSKTKLPLCSLECSRKLKMRTH